MTTWDALPGDRRAGNVATYTYDAVGNLLSITRNTGGVGTPTTTGLTSSCNGAGLMGVFDGGR